MPTPLETTHNYISHPGTNCCRPRGPLITFFSSQNSFSHSDVQTNTKSFSRRALIFCSIWMKSHRKLQNPFRRPNRDLTSMVFWDLLAHIWPWLVLVCKQHSGEDNSVPNWSFLLDILMLWCQQWDKKANFLKSFSIVEAPMMTSSTSWQSPSPSKPCGCVFKVVACVNIDPLEVYSRHAVLIRAIC